MGVPYVYAPRLVSVSSPTQPIVTLAVAILPRLREHVRAEDNRGINRDPEPLPEPDRFLLEPARNRGDELTLRSNSNNKADRMDGITAKRLTSCRYPVNPVHPVCFVAAVVVVVVASGSGGVLQPSSVSAADEPLERSQRGYA